MTERADRGARETTLWRAEVMVPALALPIFEGALAEDALALSTFEAAAGGAWRIEALFAKRPNAAAIRARLAEAARPRGLAVPKLTVHPVAERDWVRESLSQHPPVRAGRFYVHSSHDPAPVPAGARDLVIDAGVAFGTGLHESTRGCLLALDRLAKEGRRRRALDIGTGSGILAMAAALTWRTPVLAVDVDPAAVAVARENVRRNGLRNLVRVLESDGLGKRRVRERAPFDLVVANILARPLAALAPGIARHSVPGGAVVLSGLLARHEAWVGGAYLAQGMPLVRRLRLGDWVTLVLRRP